MKSKGFTIVEVLVVIGIIAVLTVIIFPSINNIRAKNRDTERVADIAAIQLGLSLYYSQSTTTEGYPANLQILVDRKYITDDSITPPTNEDIYKYQYVPLKRNSATGNKCTYYHLGTLLELPSDQIDTADTFNSTGLTGSTVYNYCGDNTTGIATGTTQYNVRP